MENQIVEKAQNQIQKIEKEVQQVISKNQKIEIKNETHKEQANEYLLFVKKKEKQIEALRQEFAVPLYKQYKKLNNEFKKQLEPLEERERQVKEALQEYIRKAKEKARKEQNKKLIEKAQKIDIELEGNESNEELQRMIEEKQDEIKEENGEEETDEEKQQERSDELQEQSADQNHKSERGTTYTVKVIDFEIEDKSKIPAKFLKVKKRAIKKALKNGEEIAGVKKIEKEQIRTRTK